MDRQGNGERGRRSRRERWGGRKRSRAGHKGHPLLTFPSSHNRFQVPIASRPPGQHPGICGRMNARTLACSPSSTGSRCFQFLDRVAQVKGVPVPRGLKGRQGSQASFRHGEFRPAHSTPCPAFLARSIKNPLTSPVARRPASPNRRTSRTWAPLPSICSALRTPSQSLEATVQRVLHGRLFLAIVTSSKLMHLCPNPFNPQPATSNWTQAGNSSRNFCQLL